MGGLHTTGTGLALRINPWGKSVGTLAHPKGAREPIISVQPDVVWAFPFEYLFFLLQNLEITRIENLMCVLPAYSLIILT